MSETVSRQRISIKQKKFVKAYIENNGNGTQAIKKAGYKVKNDKVASVLASENLDKPIIQAEMRNLGFDAESAKSVVREIMSDSTVDPNARLRATDQVFKVVGEYAPEKKMTLNVDMIDDASFVALMSKFQGPKLPDNERKAIE